VGDLGVPQGVQDQRLRGGLGEATGALQMLLQVLKLAGAFNDEEGQAVIADNPRDLGEQRDRV
jgi:hypothetical protein